MYSSAISSARYMYSSAVIVQDMYSSAVSSARHVQWCYKYSARYVQ